MNILAIALILFVAPLSVLALLVLLDTIAGWFVKDKADIIVPVEKEKYPKKKGQK